MIAYESFTLSNGLEVIFHKDDSTPMAVVNVIYNVGAKDEDPSKTGFAHLFEHLMFQGSENIPEYDEPLQKAGGENNAFTTNDLTNYYCQLPAENIETAFWLESDRMLNLAFDKKSFETEKKVVIEEFKEHYINKPYGDVWHKMRNLAYTSHPYKWMTIGAELSHVENAKLQDVKDFFKKHYNPSNAILVVAGNLKLEDVKALAEKWFADIPSGQKYNRNIPQEPAQVGERKLEVKADVPVTALYKSWHMCDRLDQRYYATEFISDILGGSASSRLYQTLVKEKKLFSEIDCFHFGSTDAGLLTIAGKLVNGVAMETAEAAIDHEIKMLQSRGITEDELQKVKNKTESILAFEDMSLMNRATNIAMYAILGDASLINKEWDYYQAVTEKDIVTQANEIFTANNCSTLYYHATQN